VNGRRYESVEDADPRIGARLEVFAAGSYLWIPFEHIATVRMEPPRRLRDLLWAPALVATGPSFKGRELGEVLLPVIAPLSWKHSDDAVRLGRVTHWEEAGEGLTVPVGQKMLLADDEEIPWLEIRSLEFEAAAEAA
jgi:type VI secretion system protein ImpE